KEAEEIFSLAATQFRFALGTHGLHGKRGHDNQDDRCDRARDAELPAPRIRARERGTVGLGLRALSGLSRTFSALRLERPQMFGDDQRARRPPLWRAVDERRNLF